LTTNSTIYIYINSPGGYVIQGLKIINGINNLHSHNINVVCVAEYAMSMAFIILQSCNTRYGLIYSSYMQHQMSINSGKVQYETLKNLMEYHDAMVDYTDNLQTTKIGMSINDFKQKYISDWYLFGPMAKTYNIVDDIVTVQCTNDLANKKYNIIKNNFFYVANITLSRCPLYDYEKVEYNFHDYLSNYTNTNSENINIYNIYHIKQENIKHNLHLMS